MEIKICTGSSCHVKGSSIILDLLKAAIKEHGLEDKVQLSGTVCIGQCKSDGVNLEIDGTPVTGVTEKGFAEFFNEKVLKVLKA